MRNDELRKKRILRKDILPRAEGKKDTKYRDSLLRLPKLAFIPEGLTVDYTEVYKTYVDAVATWQPRHREDYLYQLFSWERMVQKSFEKLTAMHHPDAAYALLTLICQRLPDFLQRSDLSDYRDTLRKRVRRLVRMAYRNLVASALLWNHEAARRFANGLICSHAFVYADFYSSLGVRPACLLALQSLEPLQGDPLFIPRIRNVEERQELARQKDEAAQKVIESEAKNVERKSLIPLSLEVEALFDSTPLSWECDSLASKLYGYESFLEAKLKQGEGRAALICFLQLMKSLCRHFVADSHYTYFDDWYSPDHAADVLMQTIRKHRFCLTDKDLCYFQEAWQEIMDSEAVREYGILHRIERL